MPTLSLIIPVYNEERQLAEFVEKLMALHGDKDWEFIFVDDKSSDRSLAILEKLSGQHKFRVIKQETNRGKGMACRRGFLEATGQFIMIQDSDFEYNPKDIPRLLQPLLDDEADVVYGSRFKKNAPQVHRTYHYLVNRFLTMLSNLFSGIYVTDMETCYKLFRADLLKAMQLQSDRFGIEVELTAYIAKTRARMRELPIEYYPRTRLQGKKINWQDGVAALIHLVHFNFFVSPEQAFDRLPQKYQP